MSERRACSLLDVGRVVGAVSHRRSDVANLREAWRKTDEKHRRFGYRRLHVILRREVHLLNRRRTQRI